MLRFFHSSKCFLDLNKSALAALRKKTGFKLINIRKALELNNNDIVKAEQWLKEQAKALGWEAAMKVQNRKTSQGLIGVAYNDNKVTMVEVNCETDFVAKNKKFVSLVELVTKTCFQYPVLDSGSETNKIDFSSEDLGNFKVNNESLSDLAALTIGSVGESIVLRKGFSYETKKNDIKLAVYVHPPCNRQILLGKYASFISYTQNNNILSTVEEPLENIEYELCKHILAMNPKNIGDYENDKPEEVDRENTLIYQEFLGDDSMTVGEIFKTYGITLLDFKRFECGEVEIQKNEEKNVLENNTHESNKAAN